MHGSLYLSILLLIGLSCAKMQGRTPASLAKLAESGECAKIIRVFFTPKQKLVRNIEDFFRHITLHVERNRRLGSELLHKFPERFDLVNEELLQAFLKKHDQSKINPNLTKKGRRFIGERLYEFYALPDSLLSQTEKSERAALIEELNKVDELVEFNFFKQNDLLNASERPDKVARQLLEIERIVDLVDRGLSRVSPEEFSRPMQKGSKFIAEELAPYAKYLERNYDKIVDGFRYLD